MGGGLLHLVASGEGLDEEYSDSVMPDERRFSDNILREDLGRIVCLRTDTRPKCAIPISLAPGESRAAQPRAVMTPRRPQHYLRGCVAG